MARKRTATKRKPAKTSQRGRFSAKRKSEAVQRLLRGEELDALSREYGVAAHTLSEWRELFLAGGQANLKTRQPTPQDEEVKRLKQMLGEMTMRNELLREKQRILEEQRPFPSRKPRD